MDKYVAIVETLGGYIQGVYGPFETYGAAKAFTIENGGGTVHVLREVTHGS